jgi:hypothetical protein
MIDALILCFFLLFTFDFKSNNILIDPDRNIAPANWSTIKNSNSIMATSKMKLRSHHTKQMTTMTDTWPHGWDVNLHKTTRTKQSLFGFNSGGSGGGPIPESPLCKAAKEMFVDKIHQLRVDYPDQWLVVKKDGSELVVVGSSKSSLCDIGHLITSNTFNYHTTRGWK